MHRLGNAVFVTVFCAMGSTAALAQVGAQPIAFKYGDTLTLWDPHDRLRFTVTGDLVCGSMAHGLVLQGVGVTDSAAAKKLFTDQTRDIWNSAGQEYLRIRQKGRDATAEEKVANQKQFVELYNKLLPEFRALVPTAQQAAFDQNLRRLQDSSYRRVNTIMMGLSCWPTQYRSLVHGFVLRGISFPDSAAVKKLVLSQAEQIWKQASKEAIVIDNKGKKATEAEREANQKLHHELYDKLLPELRPLVPAAQQTTFDQNLKALRESDYTFVVEGLPPGMEYVDLSGRPQTTSPLSAAVACDPTMENCWPEQVRNTVPFP